MSKLRLIVIAERDVHRAAVIPHEEIVPAPLMAIDELVARRVLAKIIQERLALFCRETGDSFDFLTDVERFAAGLGMYAHQRLRDRRIAALHVSEALGIVDLARSLVHPVK